MRTPEKVELTNMCMVTDGKGNVLVQDRSDKNWPGIVFPGGHVEPGESFGASVVREVREETGITVLNPTLCGVRQFITGDHSRYVVLLYRADRWEGTLASSEEGSAFWLPRAELSKQILADGFAETLPVFEDPSINEQFCKPSPEGWHWEFL